VKRKSHSSSNAAFVVGLFALAIIGIGSLAQNNNNNNNTKSSYQTIEAQEEKLGDDGDFDPANEDNDSSPAPLQMKTFQPEVIKTPECASTNTVAVDLVLDTSNSMRKNGRLDGMKSTVNSFIGLLRKDDLIGVEQFDASGRTVLAVNNYSVYQTSFASAINGLTTQRLTHMRDGLKLAHDNIKKARTQFPGSHQWIIILLTDGLPVPASTQAPQEVAMAIKNDNIRLITIGLELNQSKAHELLGSIASSPQDYHIAASVEDLKSIYSIISSSICRK
jgi:uncharacterized protein YegL